MAQQQSAERVVMVVDDDPAVCRVVVALLRRYGLDAVGVADAEAAMVRADALGDRLALLLSDVDMPGACGFDLASELRALRPDLPVLLMSGSLRAERRAQREGRAFLAKPFTGRRLADLAARLLGTPVRARRAS